MRRGLLLILIAHLFSPWGTEAVKFLIPIRSIHYDHAGEPVVSEGQYILEWLRRNYAPNGGFENWTGGIPDDWKDVSVGGSVFQESTVVYEGNYALGLTVGGGVETVNYIPVRSTIQYRLTAKIQSQYSNNNDFYFTLELYDEDYNSLATLTYNPNVEVGTWQGVSHVFDLSAYPSVRYALLVIRQGGIYTNNYYVDALSLATYNENDLMEYSDFDYLDNDDMETFTFQEAALLGSYHEGEDDPVAVMRSVDGTYRAEVYRYPLRTLKLIVRVHSVEELRQLRRVHAKTRGVPFWYEDDDSVRRQVVWPGPFPAPKNQGNPDVWVLEIPLEYYEVEDGR